MQAWTLASVAVLINYVNYIKHICLTAQGIVLTACIEITVIKIYKYLYLLPTSNLFKISNGMVRLSVRRTRIPGQRVSRGKVLHLILTIDVILYHITVVELIFVFVYRCHIYSYNESKILLITLQNA